MKNEDGELFGQIPSEKDEDGDIIYFKYDDILFKSEKDSFLSLDRFFL
jgi:hypothetical protein